MISYAPFWETIKAKGITTYNLTTYKGVSSGTLYRMRKGSPISTETINKLCGILSCQVQDILIYVPDNH